jgi:hypothetical protein
MINAEKFINAAGRRGRIFSITFVKRDGSIRNMNCRLGVTKYIKGTGTAARTGVVTVYDLQKKQYRSIRPETVLRIKVRQSNFHIQSYEDVFKES